MKVVVLGGAGDMARRAVKDLVLQPDLDKLTIADINKEAAFQFALELNDSRVEVESVDADSHADLVNKIKDYHVVCGAVGPFYRFEKKIVEACLEAGVHYVSICDDHDAINAVLPLDERAQEKKVKVLTGMGWTPGLSNLLACKGYEELGDSREINIYWGGSAHDSEGFAVILHTLHIFGGKVPTFRNSITREVNAGSEPEKIDFGGALGEIFTFNVGHPEPITLPLYLPRVQKVSLKGGLKENYLNRLTRVMARLRLTNTPGKKQLVGRAVQILVPLLKKLRSTPGYSGIRVDVTGYRGKEKLRVTYRVVDHMNNLTGLPLSIGVLMLGRGEIERLGVFAPEAPGGVPPSRFLEYLEERNLEVTREEAIQ